MENSSNLLRIARTNCFRYGLNPSYPHTQLAGRRRPAALHRTSLNISEARVFQYWLDDSLFFDESNYPHLALTLRTSQKLKRREKVIFCAVGAILWR